MWLFIRHVHAWHTALSLHRHILLISFEAGQGQIYESAYKKELKTGLRPSLSLYPLELSYEVAIDGAASLQIKPYPVHNIKIHIRVPEHQQL